MYVEVDPHMHVLSYNMDTIIYEEAMLTNDKPRIGAILIGEEKVIGGMRRPIFDDDRLHQDFYAPSRFLQGEFCDNYSSYLEKFSLGIPTEGGEPDMKLNPNRRRLRDYNG